MLITVVLIMIIVIIRWPLLSGHHIICQVKWHIEKNDAIQCSIVFAISILR